MTSHSLENFRIGGNQNSPIKNPWWVKAIPHIIIIDELINMFININLFSVLILLLWIWYGSQLQKDKIIASDMLKTLLVLIVVINVPGIINKIPIIIQMLSGLLWAFFLFLYFTMRSTLNKSSASLYSYNCLFRKFR